MLTNPIPLRSTAEWSFFDRIQAIPHVYGKSSVAPLKYSKDGLEWAIAGHSIDGVDSVIVDDVITNTYQHTNRADNTGQQIATIRLRKAPSNSIVVNCRGKIDPVIGGLMTNPGRIIWDVLANIGSVSVLITQLDQFILDTKDIEFAGVLDDANATLRSVLDDLQRSAGAAASLGIPKIAVLYPQLSMPTDHYIHGEFDALDISSLSSAESVDNIATVMRVNHAYNWSVSEYGGSVQYKCPSAIDKYGRIERAIDAPWLVTARDAANLCQRLLKYYARPVFTSTFNTSKINNIPSSAYISFSHPYGPLSGNLFVKNSEIDLFNSETQITVESAYGPQPTVALEYTSTRFVDETTQLFISYRDGIATFTVRDDFGDPLPGAIVTVNGESRIANASGEASFVLAPGTYNIVISADGYITQTVTQTISASSSISLEPT